MKLEHIATTRCEATGKVGYDHSAATAVAKRARRHKDTRTSAYRCRQCGRWHVGSIGARLRPVDVERRAA